MGLVLWQKFNFQSLGMNYLFIMYLEDFCTDFPPLATSQKSNAWCKASHYKSLTINLVFAIQAKPLDGNKNYKPQMKLFT